VVTQIMSNDRVLGLRYYLSTNPKQPFPLREAFEADLSGRVVWRAECGQYPAMPEAVHVRRGVGGLTLLAGNTCVGVAFRNGMSLGFPVDFASRLRKPDALTGETLWSEFLSYDGFLVWQVGTVLKAGKRGEPEVATATDPSTGRVLHVLWPPLDTLYPHSIPLREGGAIAEDGSRGRWVERDARGREVWETRAHGALSGVKLVFPRLRLGFDDLPAARDDLRTSTRPGGR
jgi:hypothetical protein